MNKLADAPSVPRAEAPWDLKGYAYALLYKFPRDFLDEQCSLPLELKGRVKKSSLSIVMFVNYESSNAGPYEELMFIPGQARFSNDNKDYNTITKIYVSTWDSVINGRANWGIPKDLASFEISKEEDNAERIRVSYDGRVFVDIKLKAYGISLPYTSAISPRYIRRLAQNFEGKTFSFAPSSSGTVKFAKLQDVQVDPQYFPDITQGKLIQAFKLPKFKMTFPVSTFLPAL